MKLGQGDVKEAGEDMDLSGIMSLNSQEVQDQFLKKEQLKLQEKKERASKQFVKEEPLRIPATQR